MTPTIITEDWFAGYLFEEDALVPDCDRELLDELRQVVRELRNAGRDDAEIDWRLDFEYGLSFAEVTATELKQADETMAWLHRDEDDGAILRRWNRPDDELDEIEQIEANDERAVWVERMTAFHERQLHRRLTEYFGTTGYMNLELVLRWEQRNGRWVPVEKVMVGAWIAAKIEEKGTRLSGVASCNGTIRAKIARRKIANDKTGKSGSFTRAFNQS